MLIDFETFATFTTPMYNFFGYYMDEYSLIGILSLGIFAAFISFLLYLCRPSENATQAIAITILRPFIKYICIFCGSLLVGLAFLGITQEFTWLILGIILGTFFINGILEVIFEADFKACFKHLKYSFIYLSLIIIAIVVLRFDLIYYDRKIPNASDVVSIHLSGDHFPSSHTSITLQETENITNILALTKDLLEELHTYREYGYIYSEDYTLTYELKNGTSYTRTYPIYKNSTRGDFTTILARYETILSSNEVVQSKNNYANLNLYQDATIEHFRIMTEPYSSATNYNVMIQTNQEAEQFYTLLNLIAKESSLLNDDYLALHKHTFTLRLTTNKYQYHDIDIYPCFKESIAYLYKIYYHDNSYDNFNM